MESANCSKDVMFLRQMADEEGIPLLSREGDGDGNEGQDNEGYGDRSGWVGENPSDLRGRQQATTSGVSREHFEMVTMEKEQLQEEARKRIQDVFPDWNPRESPFVATMSRGKVVVSLIDGGKISGRSYILFKDDGELRSGLSRRIVEGLGRSIHGIANELYVSVIEEEVNEKEAKITELSVELGRLKETINELNSKLGSEYLERKEEKEELVDKVKESEEYISMLESEKERMKEENDEALRRAEEDYKERIEHAVTLKMEELGATKEDNDNQVRKINEKYEEEISEKNERITDLEKRLDISNEEKRELIATTREDLERLNNRKKRRTKTSRRRL